MIAHAFFAPHHRVRNAISFFLTFVLLLLSFAALAHPLSQTAKQARPLLSAPSKPTPQPKSVSQLKVGDVIRARDHATGKVEWKQVTHASKRTVADLLKIQLADTRTGRPAETLVYPLDQSVRLSDGRTVPAGHLSIGNSIIPRAGPVCKVKAMFLMRKPGGFLLCDVRIGPLSAANARLLALSQGRQKQGNASFAVYKVPASRVAYATPNSSGGGTFNPFLFQGQQYDPASGDYFLRARYYDPTIGRFLSQDPFAGVDTDPASLHRYLYASNDPVNKIDPSGLDDLGQLEAGLAVNGELAPIEIQASGLNTLAGLNATFGAASGYAGTATPLLFSNLGGVALQRASLYLAGGFFASIIGADFAGVPGATQQVYDGGSTNDGSTIYLVHGTTLTVATTLLTSPPLLIPPGYTTPGAFHTAKDDEAGREYASEYAAAAASSALRQGEGGPALLVIGVPRDVFLAADAAEAITISGRRTTDYGFYSVGRKSYGFETLVQGWASYPKYILPLSP